MHQGWLFHADVVFRHNSLNLYLQKFKDVHPSTYILATTHLSIGTYIRFRTTSIQTVSVVKARWTQISCRLAALPRLLQHQSQSHHLEDNPTLRLDHRNRERLANPINPRQTRQLQKERREEGRMTMRVLDLGI